MNTKTELFSQQLPKVICKLPQTSDEYVLPQQNNEKLRDLFCEDLGLSGLAITLIVIACILVIILVSGLFYWHFYGGIACDDSCSRFEVKRRRRKIKRPKKLDSKQDIGGNQVKYWFCDNPFYKSISIIKRNRFMLTQIDKFFFKFVEFLAY